DFERKKATFVEGAPLPVLARAPFYYMEQRRHARRVLAIDFDTFLGLTRDWAEIPKRLIHVYSVGRCGSTLLHHALNRMEQVISLSEPDPFFQIAAQRKLRCITAWQATQLARASLACLYKETPAACRVLSVKHRGKTIFAFREFQDATPAQ